MKQNHPPIFQCFNQSLCAFPDFPMCLCTSFTSGVIMLYPPRDQRLALSSTRVLLFNVINVMYAWLHMSFVSSLMLTIKHHQCLPAKWQHLLMTELFSWNHHVEKDKHCLRHLSLCNCETLVVILSC